MKNIRFYVLKSKWADIDIDLFRKFGKVKHLLTVITKTHHCTFMYHKGSGFKLKNYRHDAI